MKKTVSLLILTIITALSVRAVDELPNIPGLYRGDLPEFIERADTILPGLEDGLRRVVINGDTADIIIPGKNLGRYDRGLFNYLFVPKKQWAFGLTVSYGELTSEDLRLFDVLGDLDVKGSAFSIRPYVSYFFANNSSIGMRLSYVRNNLDLSSMDVDFIDDLSFSLKGILYNTESYSASIFYRHYFGLDASKRFGVFNEVDLSFSSGNGQFRRVYDGEPRDTRTNTVEARLNFSPGLSVFIMENVSFDVSFGVLGFYLKNEKQKTNGTNEGSRFSSGANFKVNLFNINFGVSVHI